MVSPLSGYCRPIVPLGAGGSHDYFYSRWVICHAFVAVFILFYSGIDALDYLLDQHWEIFCGHSGFY